MTQNMTHNVLFNRGTLKKYLEKLSIEILQNLDLSEDELEDESNIIEQFIQDYKIKPIILHTEKKYKTNPEEADIRCPHAFPGEEDVTRGVNVAIFIPFSGNSKLFERGSDCSSSLPQGNIINNELQLIIQVPLGTAPDEVNREYENVLANVEKHIKGQEKIIEDYHDYLSIAIKEHVEKRKHKLIEDKKLISALDMPLKKQTKV